MFGRHKHTSRKSLLHRPQRLVIIRGDVDGHSRWVIAMVLDILTDRIDTQLDVVGRKIGSGLIRVGLSSAETQLSANSVRLELRAPGVQRMHKGFLVTEQDSVSVMKHLVMLCVIIVGMDNAELTHHSHVIRIIENKMTHVCDRIEYNNILFPVIDEILPRKRFVKVIITNSVVIPNVGIIRTVS